MKTEQAIERYLCNKVKNRGGMCVKLVGFNGIPDRLVVMNGKCVFVEMKAPNGRLSPVQIAVHKRLKALGHDVRVLWSYEEVDDFLCSYTSIKKP